MRPTSETQSIMTYEQVMNVDKSYKDVLEDIQNKLKDCSGSISTQMSTAKDYTTVDYGFAQSFRGLKNALNQTSVKLSELQTDLKTCIKDSLTKLNCFYDSEESNVILKNSKQHLLKKLELLGASLNDLKKKLNEEDESMKIWDNNPLKQPVFSKKHGKLQNEIHSILNHIEEYLNPKSQESNHTIQALLNYARETFRTEHHIEIKPTSNAIMAGSEPYFTVIDEGTMKKAKLFKHITNEHCVIYFVDQNQYEGLNPHLYKKDEVNLFSYNEENSTLTMRDSDSEKDVDIKIEIITPDNRSDMTTDVLKDRSTSATISPTGVGMFWDQNSHTRVGKRQRPKGQSDNSQQPTDSQDSDFTLPPKKRYKFS